MSTHSRVIGQYPAVERRRGFTLIELLVVIAIIAILASILLPVFAQARETARATACLSNARQLAMSVGMYTQDFDETFPMVTNYAAPVNAPDRIWAGQVVSYVKSTHLMRCPSDPAPVTGVTWDDRGAYSIGYNSNTGYDPSGAEGPRSVLESTMVTEPARSVLFADTPAGPLAAKYRGYTFDPAVGRANLADIRLSTPLVADRDLVVGSPLAPGRLKPIYARHHKTGTGLGKATLIFADGHARSYSANAIAGQQSGANLIWVIH